MGVHCCERAISHFDVCRVLTQPEKTLEKKIAVLDEKHRWKSHLSMAGGKNISVTEQKKARG